MWLEIADICKFSVENFAMMIFLKKIKAMSAV
jgi:hypothetical protein